MGDDSGKKQKLLAMNYDISKIENIFEICTKLFMQDID